MASTPRTPAPERPPPPVPAPPPPPLETPPPPSPSSPAGEEYHTPPPSLDASPREQASLPSDGRGGALSKSPLLDASPPEHASFPSDGRGRGVPAKSPPPLDAWPRGQASFPSNWKGGGAPAKSPPPLDTSPREHASFPSDAWEGGAPAKSPPLTPVRLPTPPLPPPPATPSGQNGQEGGAMAAGTAAPAHPQLHLTTGLVRTPSHGSLATKSPSSSPSPTPPSPLTPPPAVNSNKSGQSTPKRVETWKPSPPPAAAAVRFDPAEEAVTSPLRLGKARLDHHQQQQPQQQHVASSAAENGVPPDVAAVAAVGERRALSVTLRLATAVLSLAAFSVIASARTSGWAGDYYARHQQYRFIFRSMSSYYCSLFLDQVLAYLLMSASSAAASRNDLWVSRFGTDGFNRKISSALWLSFIGFLMLALNALISTANLFSMI